MGCRVRGSFVSEARECLDCCCGQPEAGERWCEVVVEVATQAFALLFAREHDPRARVDEVADNPGTVQSRRCLTTDLGKHGAVVRREGRFPGARNDDQEPKLLALIANRILRPPFRRVDRRSCRRE